MFDYSKSHAICKDILKLEGKKAQFEAVKKLEQKRQEHVIELLYLHYKAM